MPGRPAILRLLRGLALATALLAGGCAATGGGGGGDGAREEPTGAASGGKGDSPFAAEREPCATSFDCELGLQCGDDGTCRPRPTSCGSEG